MSDVAVVLSGCGVFDGTEIHEISAVCAALSRAGKKPGRKVFFKMPPPKLLPNAIIIRYCDVQIL